MVKISGHLCRYICAIFSEVDSSPLSRDTYNIRGGQEESTIRTLANNMSYILCKMQEFDAPRSLNTDKTMGFHSAKHRVSSELGDVSYLHSE